MSIIYLSILKRLISAANNGLLGEITVTDIENYLDEKNGYTIRDFLSLNKLAPSSMQKLHWDDLDKRWRQMALENINSDYSKFGDNGGLNLLMAFSIECATNTVHQ